MWLFLYKLESDITTHRTTLLCDYQVSVVHFFISIEQLILFISPAALLIPCSFVSVQRWNNKSTYVHLLHVVFKYSE